jgi:hypothetical protein
MVHVIGKTWGLESLTGQLPHKREGEVAWEPCCNRGFMAKPLAEFFPRVHATDVHDYGWGGMNGIADFLFPSTGILDDGVDWVVGNPPFRLALEFIERALIVARVGCAFLVRTSFLEGADRYDRLFSKRPPSLVAQFAERVPMHKGVLRDPALKYWDPDGKDPVTKKLTGCWKTPSTATSYCWLVWIPSWAVQQRVVWIPPCSRQLIKPGDYPVWPEIGAAPPPPTSAFTAPGAPRA